MVDPSFAFVPQSLGYSLHFFTIIITGSYHSTPTFIFHNLNVIINNSRRMNVSNYSIEETYK